MILIENAKVVTENGIIWDGAVLTENDRIVSVGPRYEIEVPKDAHRIDAKGLYVGPGFVDIHVHGGDGYMFYENPEMSAKHFVSHGETTVLVALYTSLCKSEFEQAIVKIKDSITKDKASKIIAGFYMEGPYMNPKYGCDPQLNTWKGEIKKEDYENLVNLAGDLARVWVIAPEREGIEDFMEYARKVNPETNFAVGHSEATYDEISRLKKFDLRLMTHCMDATGRTTQFSGTRGAGPDEYCMTHDNMYAELISDSMAIHVNPTIQRLILKTKGIDKVVLISDSYVNDGNPPESLKHVTDLSFDANFGLSGSKLTLDVACRNIMRYTNCGIAQAFLMASRNPARAVGLDDEIGTLEAGKKANIVFVDDEFNVNKVMFEGEFFN